LDDVAASLRDAIRDRYLLERELGRGGMATVWLARDLRHQRLVALKVLHPQLTASVGAERFLREIRIAAGLQHPHILVVHDSGEAAGSLWFTMPYVEGESLRARLMRDVQLRLDEALRIAVEVANALDYAHRHGIVHRDVKPENILLSDGHALVADFGIAQALSGPGTTEAERLTETGMVVGTPRYMSPEQATGARDLGPPTDVYALGCVAYEMLAGEPPFSGPTAQAILAKRLTQPVPSLRTVREVPGSVEQAVARALAREPADRFATAAEFGRALQAPTQGVAPPPPDATVASPGPTGPTPRARPPIVGFRLAAIVAGAIALAALGYVALRRSGLPEGTAPGHAPPPASAAVLPFADLSPGHDQEYFSDGLTDELITTLSQVSGLRVAARTSSFQFKGRDPDVREVGSKLGVGAVLEGSVRRSGDQLRVTAQLVSAADGYQLWSASYDRRLADVFAVQEDIARAIVAALQVRLGARASASLASRPTSDLAAYDLYLKGRFAWSQRTGTGMFEAARYFEQATTLDPHFSRAYAGLADATILLPSYTGAPLSAAWPKGKIAAERAIALDSTLAEAYTSLAYGTMLYAWDWPRAESLFRRAIAADSSYATAHQWYADFLTGRGRFDEALREMRRAEAVDPLSRIAGAEVGWVMYTMHRYDDAAAQLARVLLLDQNYAHTHMVLGMNRVQQRDYRGAIKASQRALELSGFFSQMTATLAAAYVGVGQRDSAIGVLRDMERRSREEFVSPFSFAIVETALGHKTEAFKWLNKAIDVKDLFVPENFNDPLLDSLRSDPRFAAVARRMGLGTAAPR
jgi:eukaryotic-like serine/threonine-protein kinase